MQANAPRKRTRSVLVGCAFLALAACEKDGSFDPDLRNFGRGGFDTSAAARQATAARPSADTHSDTPAAWLGSTSTGRWVNPCITGTAARSSVPRVPLW